MTSVHHLLVGFVQSIIYLSSYTPILTFENIHQELVIAPCQIMPVLRNNIYTLNSLTSTYLTDHLYIELLDKELAHEIRQIAIMRFFTFKLFEA